MNLFDKPFDAVKVFSATKFEERKRLGEDVTKWIASHPAYIIAGSVVTQSSDREFHCLTITLFLQTHARAA